ncbi:MAG: superfamily II RNA helicase [Planctomycetota bacterium]|jgi:superfamily II RNA helicase
MTGNGSTNPSLPFGFFQGDNVPEPALAPTSEPAMAADAPTEKLTEEPRVPADQPRAGEAESYAPDGRVVEWKGFTLLPFQIRAVEAIRAGRNVLVSAPTGAGKTLVAEYAMEDAVRRGLRCIYTSPIKALSNQKYRDFRDDPAVDVGIMTGDVTINPGAQVLIMTTEILRNAIFENRDLLADVAHVIFDEIHYMDDRERGTVWEESLIFLPKGVRLVCLSATISNVEEVGAWLDEIRHETTEVILEARRPVPLSHWIWTERSGSFDPSKLKFQRKKAEQELADRRAASKARKRRSRGARGGSRRGGGGHVGPPDPTKLFDELCEKDMMPTLVFSFSRKDCERLAIRNADRELLNPEAKARMLKLQDELVLTFKTGEGMLRGEIMSMARNGVAYHHAGMLPVHKEMVERMFTEGLLKLLFTTETFAIGINMPARSVVFNALRKFDGVDFDWLRTRDYMQMAGRAGRQGMDDKGFVYSVCGPRELVEAPLERLFAGKPEPVTSRFRLSYSTLLHLVDRLGREQMHEAWERSFHVYQSREKNKRARERQSQDQRRLVERHLTLLEDFGYLKGDKVTPRGKVARLLAGYELQVTELLFQGTLEHLPPQALAMTMVAMIFEERRRNQRTYVPNKLFGSERQAVGHVIGDLCGAEARLGIGPGMKRPDWGLTPAVLAWYGGTDLAGLEEAAEAPMGDVCRVFRMALQLMRNLRRAIDPEWDLSDRLEEAIIAINRDEVDARRQLQLG